MNTKLLAILPVLLVTTGCHTQPPQTKAMTEAEAKLKGLSVATFAGGCFWCMEEPFDELEGVVSTTSGYTGGQKKDPTYREVSAGGTGHTEAVQIVYDPHRVTYDQLLDVS